LDSPIGAVSPTSTAERITSLDVLRGVAILGILVMNIQSFSMIQSAYMNPTSYGDLSGLNGWVWRLSHLFAAEKFITLFSLMFGAGIVLMAERLEAKGRNAGSTHYRRTFFLLLIGLAHAYLLWYGDILFVYGLCALVVYLFRKRTSRTLLLVGLVGVAIPSALYLLFGLSMPSWPEEARAGMLEFWLPNAEMVADELAAYRGSWLDQMEHRVPASLFFHTLVFLIWGVWRTSGLMLIGMALYKWGVLSGRRSWGPWASAWASRWSPTGWFGTSRPTGRWSTRSTWAHSSTTGARRW
jgi:uncharacterized protein